MDSGEIASCFQRLNLQNKTSVSLEKTEPHYVLDLAAQPGGHEDRLVAATSSNHTVRLFSRQRLSQTALLRGHEDVISAVHFLHSDPNILLTSSYDRSVRCWDIRANMLKEVQLFQGEGATDCNFLSCDINATDRLVCAGSEKVGDNVFLLFWDRRKNELMGCYSESHNDDITQVTFHPTAENNMASGSTDGLLNVFDVAQTSEEDALLSTFNTEATVARAGWCGPDAKHLYCVTHMDTWHVWDGLEGDSIQQVLDIKQQLEGKHSVDYLVDCIPSSTACECLLLVAGSHSGNLSFLDVSDPQHVKVTASLEGGHSGTVRCLNWDQKSQTLLTGAEDSLLCLWSPKATASADVEVKQGKIKGKKMAASKRSKPYTSKVR